MGEVAKLERDALFKKLRAKPENKVVFRGSYLTQTDEVMVLIGLSAAELVEKNTGSGLHTNLYRRVLNKNFKTLSCWGTRQVDACMFMGQRAAVQKMV